MSLFWIGVGLFLGIFNHCTRWWIIQIINPNYALISPVRLVISSSAIRIMLIGVVFYFAIQQDVRNGFLLAASLLITRWLGMIYINRK